MKWSVTQSLDADETWRRPQDRGVAGGGGGEGHEYVEEQRGGGQWPRRAGRVGVFPPKETLRNRGSEWTPGWRRAVSVARTRTGRV